jgi:triphosphatase
VPAEQRGYDLAEGKRGPEAVHSDQVERPTDATTEDAFRAIAYECLHHVADNFEAVMNEDPDGVHQMRVGLRRLRAAISIFSDVLDDEQTRKIKRELKWLTGELGPARQFRRFDDAKSRAMRAVSSERFRELLLDAAEWIEVGSWRQTTNSTSVRPVPAREFATENLRKRTAKIVKKGKKLRQLDAEKRHKLRIAAKKLRYGGEFFTTLFPGRKCAKRREVFLKKLKRPQDCR